MKLAHGFRCQLCGTALVLPGGLLYAEAHHVRPLGTPHNGTPHNGPDELEDIVCVCPNHHALLDLAAIPPDPAALRSVRPGHVPYHNALVAQRRPGLPA